MKSRIKDLLNSYREIYRGPNWIEVALVDVLTAVDSKLAFTDPPGGRNSIAKIVCHLVYIRSYLLQKLQGDQTTVINQEASFDTAAFGDTPETAWQNLRRELASSFQNITSTLETAEPEILTKQALPRDYNFDYLIAGIIQHEAYHLGQLVLLKNQLQQLTQNS